MKVVQIQVEPLTSDAFGSFGEVIGEDTINLVLRQNEKFRMGIIHACNEGFQIASMNFHKNSTQALVPLEGKACLVVVAPPGAIFKMPKDLKQIKAFVCDGRVGINIGLRTWHKALLPLGPEMNMVNVQGVNSGEDTYGVDFKDSFDAIVEVKL